MITTKEKNEPPAGQTNGNGLLLPLEQMIRTPLDNWNQETGGAFDELRNSGATDDALLGLVGNAFSSCSSLDKRISWKGGKNPKFQMQTGPCQVTALTGKRLLAKVRDVMAIGAPGSSTCPLCGEGVQKGHICEPGKSPKPLVDPSLLCVCGHGADAHAPFNSPEEPPQECIECRCDAFVGEPAAVGMLQAMSTPIPALKTQPRAKFAQKRATGEMARTPNPAAERLHKAAVARWRRERPASADDAFISESLSETEKTELSECETVIKRNLAAFYETGEALLRIRDGRLYRATHATFEEYCRERWGMGRAHAYRLIDSAEIVENLSPVGDIPTTERQARALTGLEPALQREVWQAAIETAPQGKVTAGHIRETRQFVKLHISTDPDNREQKQIRHEAASEICDRVIQSLTDNPFFLKSLVGSRDAGRFLAAIAFHLITDDGLARFIAKRRGVGFESDPAAALSKTIPGLSEPGTLELIVEYLIAEELDSWIKSGELPQALKRFLISEYFGHDPRKIEKRIAKEHAAAKKAKPKAKTIAGA